MTGYTDPAIWLIIIVLAAGTFCIRFSFLGLFGARAVPVWLLRYLRYTPVTVIPALIAPLVLWPAATGGQPDPVRLLAAAATVLAGCLTRNAVAAILAGGGTFALGLLVMG